MIKKSILAGIAISIGCVAYLITGYAWLFPIGLFIVCTYKLNLFTGKVCYAKLDPVEMLRLIIIWLFNVIAAFDMGILMRYVRPDLVEKTGTLCATKLAETPLQLGIRAVLCNIMIFVAVETYARTHKYLGLIFATTIFVACGFEHCVANAFYFGLGVGINGLLQSLVFLIPNTIFNALGGICAYRLLIGE